MDKRLLYTGIALVLGAALGIAIFAPQPVREPNPPADDAPDARDAQPMPGPAPTREPVVLHDVSIPTRRSPGQLADHNVVLVQPGDRDLRVVADYEAAGTEPGLTWPFVTLLDPDGEEVERCEAPDCDWTIPEPTPGHWIVAVAADGSWSIHLTVSLVRAEPVALTAELANQTRVVPRAPPPSGWLEAFVVERDDVLLELRLTSTGLASCGATVNVDAPDGRFDRAVLVPQTLTYERALGRWQVGVSPGTCTGVSVLAAHRPK